MHGRHHSFIYMNCFYYPFMCLFSNVTLSFYRRLTCLRNSNKSMLFKRNIFTCQCIYCIQYNATCFRRKSHTINKMIPKSGEREKRRERKKKKNNAISAMLLLHARKMSFHDLRFNLKTTSMKS